MTLHVNRSTVGHDAPLAPLAQDAETPAGAGSASRGGETRSAASGDSVAVSGQAKRLAAMDRGEEQAQLKAVDQADALVRTLLARAAADPKALSTAQGAPDPARVAQLLQG